MEIAILAAAHAPSIAIPLGIPSAHVDLGHGGVAAIGSTYRRICSVHRCCRCRKAQARHHCEAKKRCGELRCAKSHGLVLLRKSLREGGLLCHDCSEATSM